MAFPLTCGHENEPSSSQSDERTALELEYRCLETELSLSRTDSTYLVLDFERKRIELKLRAAEVWGCPMVAAPDSVADLDAFQRRFENGSGTLARRLLDKHLFRAEDQISDSVLRIVSEAVNVDPGKLQRELPERFQLRWNDRAILEVTADVNGRPVSRIRNAVVGIRGMLESPLGESTLSLRMKPDDALTLYRAVSSGTPTLLIPSL